ncbi:Ubiquinol oxidase 2, mitochondrial [Capsicum chinense]|nr:Ubiquinol oxidase 2, mitochondrial [Capsicum chinense]
MGDLSIDLSKHYVPKKFLDKVAYWSVKLLRIPTDLFLKERYGCRAMMLETVAGVPGMVGGMLLHLRSLRKFELLRSLLQHLKASLKSKLVGMFQLLQYQF